MEGIALQSINLLLSAIAIILLIKVLRRTGKDFFIVSMLVSFLALSVFKVAFSTIYLFDKIDGIDDVLLYNALSTYISILTASIIVWVGILALNRGKL